MAQPRRKVLTTDSIGPTCQYKQRHHIEPHVPPQKFSREVNEVHVRNQQSSHEKFGNTSRNVFFHHTGRTPQDLILLTEGG